MVRPNSRTDTASDHEKPGYRVGGDGGFVFRSGNANGERR